MCVSSYQCNLQLGAEVKKLIVGTERVMSCVNIASEEITVPLDLELFYNALWQGAEYVLYIICVLVYFIFPVFIPSAINMHFAYCGGSFVSLESMNCKGLTPFTRKHTLMIKWNNSSSFQTRLSMAMGKKWIQLSKL